MRDKRGSSPCRRVEFYTMATAPTPDVIARAWDWILQPLHFGAIVMPSFLVGGATLVRWALSLPFTSWADALLAFVAFDATVVIDSETFQFIFASPAVAKHSVGIHLVLLMLAAVCWVMLVWRAEKELSATSPHHTSAKAYLVSGIGVIAVSLFIVAHVFTYLAKG